MTDFILKWLVANMIAIGAVGGFSVAECLNGTYEKPHFGSKPEMKTYQGVLIGAALPLSMFVPAIECPEK